MATKKNVKKNTKKKKPVTKKKSNTSLATKKTTVKKSTAAKKKPVAKKTSTVKKPVVKKTAKKPIIETTTIVSKTHLDSKKEKLVSAYNEYKLLFFMLIGLGILIAILIVVLIINNKDNYKKNLYTYKETQEKVPENIKKVYELFTSVNCGGDYKWTFGEENIKLVSDVNNTTKIDLTFKVLENNNMLDDSITKEEYNDAQKKIFGLDLEKPADFDEYNYAGYDYKYKKDKITRDFNICLKQTEYISALDSYEIKENKLYLYVNIGYVSDGSLYNVDDKLIKTYYNSSEKSELLKSSTKYKYTFNIVDNSYYFESVEKIES